MDSLIPSFLKGLTVHPWFFTQSIVKPNDYVFNAKKVKLWLLSNGKLWDLSVCPEDDQEVLESAVFNLNATVLALVKSFILLQTVSFVKL